VRKIIVTTFAQNDIRNIAIWLTSRQDGLTEQFDAEIHEALRRIQLAPQIYPPGSYKVRRCLLKRFRYHIYFYLAQETIRVVGVVHTSRSPRFIKKTLRKRK